MNIRIKGKPKTKNFNRKLGPPAAIAANAGTAPLANSIANTTTHAWISNNATISPDIGI